MQKVQKDKKTSFLKEQVENTDLYKPVLNKVMTSQEQCVKYNFMVPLIIMDTVKNVVRNADIFWSFYVIKYWTPCLSWGNINLIWQIIFLADSESPIFLDMIQEKLLEFISRQV